MFGILKLAKYTNFSSDGLRSDYENDELSISDVDLEKLPWRIQHAPEVGAGLGAAAGFATIVVPFATPAGAALGYGFGKNYQRRKLIEAINNGLIPAYHSDNLKKQIKLL